MCNIIRVWRITCNDITGNISLGILLSGGIETVSLETYDKQMNINVRSVYHLTQLALPHLLKTKGNIVNISSVTGVRAVSEAVVVPTR